MHWYQIDQYKLQSMKIQTYIESFNFWINPRITFHCFWAHCNLIRCTLSFLAAKVIKSLKILIYSVFKREKFQIRSYLKRDNCLDYNQQHLQMTNLNIKELSELKEQLKKQIVDLDHQIYELETFYIEDTKETGNLLKGFQNYLSAKTARNQGLVKKQKVQNYERLFSLSSIKSKTSQILEESYLGDSLNRMETSQSNPPKRNRPRVGGMTKTGGKHLMSREEPNQDDESQSGEGQNMEYSMDQSEKNKGISKKKKITKSIIRKA